MPKSIARRFVKPRIATAKEKAGWIETYEKVFGKFAKTPEQKWAEKSPVFQKTTATAESVGLPCRADVCVPSAISSATGRNYRDVYKGLFNEARTAPLRTYTAEGVAEHRKVRKNASPRDGVRVAVTDRYMKREFGVDRINRARHVNDFPKRGTFVLGTGRHLFTLKNGKLIDYSDPRGDMLRGMGGNVVSGYYDLRGKLRPRK